jgi:hypothetical protein
MPTLRCPTYDERFPCVFEANCASKAVTCPGCQGVFFLKRKQKPTFGSAPPSVLALDRPPESSLPERNGRPYEKDISLTLHKIQARKLRAVVLVALFLGMSAMALWMALRDTQPTAPATPVIHITNPAQKDEALRQKREMAELKEKEQEARNSLARIEEELRETERLRQKQEQEANNCTFRDFLTVRPDRV